MSKRTLHMYDHTVSGWFSIIHETSCASGLWRHEIVSHQKIMYILGGLTVVANI